MDRSQSMAVRLFCTLLALILAPIHNPLARAQEPELVLSPIWNVAATSNGISTNDEVGPEYIVNRSGLNANNEHSNWPGDMWHAMEADGPIYVQFEFEDVYPLEEMWIWNYNSDWWLEHGVKDVTVEYSEDGIDWTVFGNIECAMGTGTDDYAANTIVSLGGILARYVRLTILSTYGTFPAAGLSEVQFRTFTETIHRIYNVTATSNVASREGNGPENTVDDSGMNANGGHSTWWVDMWIVDPNGGPVYIQFELGGLYELEQMWVWNCNTMGFQAKDVTIEYSEDGIDWVTFGGVRLGRATGQPNCPVSSVISLNGIAARYVRLTIHNTWEANVTIVGREGILDIEPVGLSEVRFFTKQPPPGTPASYVLVLDSFEQYTDEEDLGEAIFQTWIDDVQYGGNARVGHWYTPFAETEIVHSGAQAMPFFYTNANWPYYAETYRDLEGPLQNWRIDGAEALTLYFHGSTDQDHHVETDWLYVVVEDGAGGTAVVYHPDPDALRSNDWQQWSIDLDEFAAVDLSHVVRLILGVGNHSNLRPGGNSVIYIDDIGLGAAPPEGAEN
ncbi:discoidin domain-containing protein [Anaerobaca lacustris]|uniref:Discoidin domain-containing protein n=1 Tax=Anaerobaca lacustris TaxID=3044600 RepID=A0AAW6TTR9_9BACT|nr:discoidin domain-containing protein [Sedimentisphaerales bacterium M17dextr]